jgi:hypothetical protein
MGGLGAERADVGGAVNTDRTVDSEPACLERIVRSRGHGGTCELSGPVGVRHIPDRINLLVLDVVEASGRVIADLTERNRVALAQLQVLVEAQLEAASIDREVGGILSGQIVGCDRRLELLDLDLDSAVVGVLEGLLDVLAEPRRVDVEAGLRLDRVE